MGFYDERSLCRLLTLSRSTVWAMVKDGEFPAPVRLSARRVAWRRADVDEWVSSRSPATAAA